MDYSDYDEAAAAKRKKDVVEYRNKKRLSSIFTFCASVFEIVVSFAIFFALYILAVLIITRLPVEDPSVILFPATIVILVLSIIIGFKIYKVVFRAIIKKKGLEDKLLDSVLYHYKTKKEIQDEMDSGLRL